MQAGVDLLVSDVMPIYMIIALDIVITMRFSVICPTVICPPTICYVFEREASSENYGPGSTFTYYKNQSTLLQSIYFYFVLEFIYLSIAIRINPCK